MPRHTFRSSLFAFALLAMVPQAVAADAVKADVQLDIDERAGRIAGIETAPPVSESGAGEITLQGTVTIPPNQLAVVAAPAAGLVETILISPDETVKAGQPIARLRSSELIEMQRLFLEALAASALASDHLRRDETMYGERLIAQRRLLTTRSEASFATSRLQEREQMLLLAGMPQADIASLRRSRKLVPTLTVLAPVDGVVIRHQASVGERVAQAAPLFSIGQLRPLWVNLQVPVSRAAAVANAQAVAVPAQGARGRLLRIGRSVDPETQSTSATAEITEGIDALRPGQAVTAILELPPNGRPQWRVPAGSVVRHQQSSWIFVKTNSGYVARPATILAETPQSTTIRAELNKGEEVAVRGILFLLAELAETDRS